MKIIRQVGKTIFRLYIISILLLVPFIAAGADIIDVGGESTRPGASNVWEGDEIERVVPIIRQLAGGGAAVSIDTRKAGVIETESREDVA